MGHQLNLNKSTIIKVGNLLPRLKHAVEPIKLINWLENFKENEIDLVIDLLSVYEYIPFNEFMFRLDDILKEIFKNIPKGEKIIIFPYGKVGKSGTLVTYPLKNTNAFKIREEDILLTHDYEYIENPTQYKHFIFLDDFIGSGKSFCKVYSKENSIQKWIKNHNIGNVYVLATIVMAEGKKYINHKFNDIQVIAEERNKIFDENLSPLKVFGNTKEIEELCIKYGVKLSKRNSRGFDNSESLVSYFHTTPNNTLPIIWYSNKGWLSLFPRFADIKMGEARAFKKEIAFYIGVCNRLGLDLYTGKSILEKKQDRYVRKRSYNTKEDHSIIALLFLKKLNYDDLIICHLLGITKHELDEIYTKTEEFNFIDKRHELTNLGILFLKELKKRTNKENFRKETKESLRIKNEVYIPQQFNYMT